jgi:hypothetical protein
LTSLPHYGDGAQKSIQGDPLSGRLTQRTCRRTPPPHLADHVEACRSAPKLDSTPGSAYTPLTDRSVGRSQRDQRSTRERSAKPSQPSGRGLNRCLRGCPRLRRVRRRTRWVSSRTRQSATAPPGQSRVISTFFVLFLPNYAPTRYRLCHSSIYFGDVWGVGTGNGRFPGIVVFIGCKAPRERRERWVYGVELVEQDANKCGLPRYLCWSPLGRR